MLNKLNELTMLNMLNTVNMINMFNMFYMFISRLDDYEWFWNVENEDALALLLGYYFTPE